MKLPQPSLRTPRRLGAAAVLLAVAAGSWLALSASAQAPARLSDHVRQDIQRHRAMAVAHETAARCLESGRDKKQCHSELQAACKGLAIGKYCGMRHEH